MTKLKVLFDWDIPDLDPLWAIKRGIRLVLFGCFNLIHIKPWFLKDMYKETDEYAIALTKLNELLDVDMIYGIRDNVLEEKRPLIESFKNSGKDVRRHIHIGKKGSNRKRLWEPPLNQSMDTWHYDADWEKGKKVLLKEGELPIWHFSAPHRMVNYVDFLCYNLKEKKRCSKEGDK
jgi:hypothetical protein